MKDRSIWWGLSYNNKALALTQSCSTKAWNLKGISLVQDILIGGRLGVWEEIKGRFNIPDSQKKTFTLIKKVIKFNSPCDIIDSKVFLDKTKWVDGVLLKDTTTKALYLCMKNDSSLIARVI